jgi:hypothetical protein
MKYGLRIAGQKTRISVRSKLSWALPSQIEGTGCSASNIRLGRVCFRAWVHLHEVNGRA